MLSYSMLIVKVAKEKWYLFSYSNNKPSCIFIPDIYKLRECSKLNFLFCSDPKTR